MKFNYNVILSIVFGSSILGLLINSMSENGISLARQSTNIEWADDSLFILEDTTGIIDLIEKDTINNILGNTVTDKKDSIEKYENTVKEQIEEEKKLYQVDPLPPPKDTIKTTFTEPKAIKLAQAFTLFKKGILFVDARDPSDYEYGHIKGAINFPYDLYNEYKTVMNNISKDKPVVVYCGGSDCELSVLLGNELFKSGYKEVYVFFGGWNEWLEAEYPVENK